MKEWEWEVDHDGDGISTRREYFAGTDPFDRRSTVTASIRQTGQGYGIQWNSLPGVRFQLVASPDLVTWSELGDPVLTGAVPGEVLVTGQFDKEFYGVDPLEPMDADDDGLSDREEAILGTNPRDKNTDGDGMDDGFEVLRRFTDPLVFDPAGGSISGKLFLDDDLSGDLTGATPIEGAEVFLDLNFNGDLDDLEPRVETAADGAYLFENLRPGIYEVRQILRLGETQTVPVNVTPLLPDRVPDEVLEYVHLPEGAELGVEFRAFDTSYGYNVVDDWPGFDWVIVGARISEVDPELVLLPIGDRGDLPPIGSYARSHFLTLPDGASITVGFEETIYDGPGPDFMVAGTAQGFSGTVEPGDFYIGPSADDLTQVAWDTLPNAKLLQFDLADYPQIPFVRAMKLVSRTPSGPGEGGTDRGLGITGFEGINVLPLSSSARRVEILGTETVSDQDFGRYFQDLPPSVILSTPGARAIAGQAYPLQVVANDDLGIASTSLIVNGQALALDAEGRATFTQSLAGKMEVIASTTDTGGQSDSKSYTILVADENGVLPFDPKTLPGNENSGGPRIEIFTPESGEVPTVDAAITGTIVSSQGQAVWSIQYAPIADIDPGNLAAADPDYIEISTGTTNEYNAALATFPTSTLADGIYFIRVVAQAAGGGESSYHGQIIGINVDPATLRPQLEIHSPSVESEIALVQDVRASLVSDRPIAEWKVAYADRTQVDLTNLGADDPDWVEVANGSGTFTDQAIAALDTTRMKNGSYVVRLTAFNDLRLGRLEAVEFEVTSPAKPGRNRREFVDAELELAGFPLQLRRVYDSLDSDEAGDFGFGWSLDLANPNILETVPDTGASIFGATPYRDGTRVYLDAPNGQRVGFTFHAEFKVASLLGALYQATFEADPGNPYQLGVPEGDAGFLSQRSDGEVRLSFIGLPWNPDLFILTDQEGTQYTYDQRKGFLGLEDRNGNALTVTHQGFTHSSGPALIFTRDDEGRITKVTAPGGAEWTYDYSLDGDLTGVTGPGGETTFGYHDTIPHFLTDVTDPFGRVGVQYEYDADGQLVAIIDENGHREEHSWDPASLTGSMTDRRGNVTQLVYDDRGNVTRLTDALGNVTTITYGDERHPDTETEIVTENTRIRYGLNEMGQVIGTRFGDSFFTDLRRTYTGSGELLKREYVGGRIDYFEYDEQGNLSSEYKLLKSFPKVDYTYTSEGQIETQTRNDKVLTFRYDPLTGKKLREEGPFGFLRTFSYHPDGSIAAIADASGATFTLAADAATSTTTISSPNGGSQAVGLDLAGNLLSVDPEGGTIGITMDSEGNELVRTLPNGSQVTRVRDEEANVTSITVPGGHENQFTFDALNRQTSMTDANFQTTTVTYDAEGRVVERTNRNGKRIGYTYNSMSQVVKETWFSTDDVAVREFLYTYHSGTTRLSSVTDGLNTWTYQLGGFDERPTTITFSYEGQADYQLLFDYALYLEDTPRRIRISDSFDPFLDFDVVTNFVGERPYSSRCVPEDGSPCSVRHRYDHMGRITDIDRFNVSSTSDIKLDPISRTRMSYFSNGDRASIRHEDNNGDLHFPDSESTFTRDLVGRILTRTTPLESSTLTYDSMGQLVSVDHTAGVDEMFTYDVAGNPASGTYGPDNRLLSLGDLTFIYDNEGNVITRTNSTSGEIRSYEYDHRNQLISVSVQATGGAPVEIVAEYQYDYLGRLMSRSEDGQKTWLLPERNTTFAEFRDGELEVSKVYYYDLADVDNRYAEWRDDDTVIWYLTDQVQSVTGTLNLDGSPRHWVDYDAFGQPLTVVPADFGPHRFAGRYWNETAGLYENTQRHYDPVTGRFQQQDPIRYESGDFNLYRYAGNNPISSNDPLGTSAASEYGVMLKRVSSCVKKIKPVGECVNQLLMGAADAIKGKGGKSDVGCVIKSTGGMLQGCPPK
ncbi:RHS repeat-associated core domain-containing protein [Verrucomicrobiaceae bacterium 227]